MYCPHDVLPTWRVLLADQHHEHFRDVAKGKFSFSTCCITRVPAGQQRGLRGEQLQHVNGAGQVAGPVGAQHGLGLVSEDGGQVGAGILT